jgi:hypothetical protein
MKTVIYEPLEQSDASWYCCSCGLPNFNTNLFEDFEIHTCSLSSNLNETSTSINDSIQSTTNIGPPQCTSSPTKQKKYPVNKKSLRLLNINFQSMKAKREEFWSMLEYTDPDIIIASETWLRPEIKESEVLPDSYHFVARKDRPGSAHGGTAIIARSNMDAVEVDTNTTTEFVAAAFSCKNLKKLLIIGSLLYTDQQTTTPNKQMICVKRYQTFTPASKITSYGSAGMPNYRTLTGRMIAFKGIITQ